MATFARQKEYIYGVIHNGTCSADLYSLIDSIHYSDLQSLFLDFVSRQTSPEKMVKMYYATKPLPNAIGDDCMRHVMEYLKPKELVSMSCVCRKIKSVCAAINGSNSRFDDLLLSSPVFEQYCTRKPRGKFQIGYFLQNMYDLDDLNEYSFKGLGEKGILMNEDKEVYDICNHFGFKCKLLAWSQTSGDSAVRREEQPFEDCTASGYWSDWDEPPWDTEYGTGVRHAKVTEYQGRDVNDVYDLCPVVCITCPAREWRKKLSSRKGKK